ncbi:MAG: exodeoxyribonuclease III [Burkholderiaceae bacterium]
MKIATWNVNSLNVRLGHVLDWLAAEPVDILALQETKLIDAKFPADTLREAGYDAVFAGQRTYNGVALLTRSDTIGAAADVVVNNPTFADEQMRLISATCAGLRVVCAYVPNGQEVDSDKYFYKLAWLDALIPWLEAGAGNPGQPRILLGDFNIAPEDRDVHDPEAWREKVLCSTPERERFQRLQALGLHDAFRRFEHPEKTFSWWDYRQLGFQRNAGLRIDHILVEEALLPRLNACSIDRAPRKWPKPSDHAPVVMTLDT